MHYTLWADEVIYFVLLIKCSMVYRLEQLVESAPSGNHTFEKIVISVRIR